MDYTAQWGPKGFLISPEKIVPFFDLATTISLKTDSGTDTSGAVATNAKGLEPQQVEFSTTYFKSLNVDPRAQYDEWASLVGASHPLLIGGKRFGAEKMQLQSVTLSDVRLTPKGEFICATISVVLSEPTAQKTTSSGGSGKASTVSSSTSNNTRRDYLPVPPNGKLTERDYLYAMHTMPEEDRANSVRIVSAAIPGNGLNYNVYDTTGRGGGGITTLAGPKDSAIKR